MVFKGMTWAGVTVCFVLYCLVFMIVRYEVSLDSISQSQPRLGLLLFALPGAIAAMTTKEAPLTSALVGAFLASPVVLLTLHLSLPTQSAILQELAFSTSAIFWCGSGALAVMLSRTLLGREEQS